MSQNQVEHGQLADLGVQRFAVSFHSLSTFGAAADSRRQRIPHDTQAARHAHFFLPTSLKHYRLFETRSLIRGR